MREKLTDLLDSLFFQENTGKLIQGIKLKLIKLKFKNNNMNKAFSKI